MNYVRKPTALEAGFTLLEVIVALAVFGFILVGLGQGLDFGIRSTVRQARIVAANGELDAVDRALRRLVAETDPDVDVVGTPGAVAFTSRLPSALNLSTREADVALGLNQAHALVLRWTPHLHALRFGPPPPTQEAELTAGLARLVVAYWSRDGGWRATWSDHELPGLIRFHLVFPDGDPRHWADIVAAPMQQRTGS